MKKLKRIIASVLVFVLLFAVAASGSQVTAAEQGKVLNIWGWNDEFQGLFETYFTGALDGVEVNFTLVPNDGNAYQNALDEALLNQENAPDDEKIDLFLVVCNI